MIDLPKHRIWHERRKELPSARHQCMEKKMQCWEWEKANPLPPTPRERRLDYVDWYDCKEDMVMCLICRSHFERINSQHLRTHGIRSMEHYRQLFDILPKTPLCNKRTLRRLSQEVKAKRASGEFNVFQKGETSIPIEYRKSSDGKGKYRNHPEYAPKISDVLKGRPCDPVRFQKMIEGSKKAHREGRYVKNYFKKGDKDDSRSWGNIARGKSWEELFGLEIAEQKKAQLRELRLQDFKNKNGCFSSSDDESVDIVSNNHKAADSLPPEK